MKNHWDVVKFGGTSVTGDESWNRIQQIVQQKLDQGKKVLVVCSALSTVSNRLEALANKVKKGDDFMDELQKIEERHREQAKVLSLSAEEVIGDLLQDLTRLAHGASLIQEVSAKLWARILSAGELMSTRLGARWLTENGIATKWLDARKILITENQIGDMGYLSATSSFEADSTLQTMLESFSESVVVTQGFIGSNEFGETVLLGRGGSDTSAAYFAAKIEADLLEIWTDVPGLFTANPKQIPSARLLRVLDYGEAQELATTGAKALHPRSVPPVRKANIPLRVRSTFAPELEGTLITHQAQSRSGIKGISARKGIALISMDTVGMWQQVGFLADVFGVLKRHQFSVDLVATSEANVTVSLDVDAHSIDREKMDRLLHDLQSYCTPKFIGPVASISMVGRNIRSILHQLGPIFERFADRKVHLLSQAASDLNLTFVVEEDEVDSLIRSLHAKLFSQDVQDPSFGPTWSALFEEPVLATKPWWVNQKEELLALGREQSPCFVYHKETLNQRAQELLSMTALERVFFAIKANPHPEILGLFHQLGLGFECVSPEELCHVRELFPSLPKERLLFTPNFAPQKEYAIGFKLDATITLDSIYPLIHWPDTFAGREVIIRVDTGKGKGHHKYVVTAGSQSKFGIPPQDFAQLVSLTKQHDIRVVGLHAHAGSGIKDPLNWQEKGSYLLQLREHFPHIRVLNLGGGFGIPERPNQPRLDIDIVAQSLDELKMACPDLALWIEPGRYLVAEAGVLLATVTQLKNKGERVYVGLDVGMNTLIRPALYGSWHQIDSLSRLEEHNEIIADLVGPICESGDVLGRGRSLPDCQSGDVMIIQTAGAYGRSMSSRYNLREPAPERFV
jgi:bifunctional diaminopimelate decarboxylase / aspartate kinase